MDWDRGDRAGDDLGGLVEVWYRHHASGKLD